MVLLDDGSGMIGCPIVLVDRITVNLVEKDAIPDGLGAAVGSTDFVARCECRHTLARAQR